MISGSYNYPGVYGGAPPLGSDTPYAGKGPLAVYIIGSSGTISTTGGGASSAPTTVAISGTVVSQTSSFTGANYSTLLSSVDLALYSNVAITMINNHASNTLQSASVEWSPNNSQFEQWDTSTFAGLAGGGTVRSMQILGNSRRYLRIRGIPSGSGGALTGSVEVWVHANNG